MNDKLWSKVDDYICDRLLPADAVLEAALKANAAAGLPQIDVSAAQGKFLHMLARMVSARRILEIGTLGGYSTIWLARALPAEGRLISLEADALHAKIARENVDRAGLAGVTEIRLGKALETLPSVEADKIGPFDFVFIDADKGAYDNYYERSLKLTRPGGLIAFDNMLWSGAAADPAVTDPDTSALRALNTKIHEDERVDMALATIGDGVMLARVR